MSDSRRPQKGDQPARWEYPDITSDEYITSMRRNAVNKPMRWQFEPPEPEPAEEEDEAPQLTAEMLEAIREEARQEGIAEGREEGLKSGHEEGFKQGYDEGLLAGKSAGEAEAAAAGEQLQQELSLRWQQLFEHMRQPALQINEGVERQLVTMTATLAQAICMHEVETNPSIIQQVVQHAVTDLTEQAGQLKIALHPLDIELIKQRWNEQELTELGWRIEQDASLTRGGCVVTTPVTRVDATLESRINDVFKYYIKGLKGSDGQPMRSEPQVDAVEQQRSKQHAEAEQKAQAEQAAAAAQKPADSEQDPQATEQAATEQPQGDSNGRNE
ncbi:flagellar assembly protein FliH [Aliidiomarina soli]|uniref:Flagellar assembly protein FliH n=1 Tax=Aliidiomarina soli TaxID=1928574 RepID=A0A432WEJ2_9GAMM|nr:flagellar assembly protein FliH [Aliidiomarina soli]RUO31282.1 hypothetical protein CWE14_12405 [Aliidiomarina soli]